MKRVLLSADTLRVSKPGFDVETATFSQLLLSLDFTFGQLLAHGMLTLSPTGAGLNRRGVASIGPFTSPPQVFAWGVDGNGRWEALPAVRRSSGAFSNVNTLFEKWTMSATTTTTTLTIDAFENTRALDTSGSPRYSQVYGNTVPPYAAYLLYRSRLA